MVMAVLFCFYGAPDALRGDAGDVDTQMGRSSKEGVGWGIGDLRKGSHYFMLLRERPMSPQALP